MTGAPRVSVERRGRWADIAFDLDRWIEARDFRGWDPYDALASPVVRALTLGTRWGGVAWTQLLRRAPVQLRPLLGVPRLENPKALALTLAARLRTGEGGDRVTGLVGRLEAAAAPGGGWGYPFAWAHRDARIPRATPNAVATAFAGHALLDAERAGFAVSEETLRAAGSLVVHRLHRIPGPEGTFCFSYTPVDRRAVHNASLLAASLLARLSERLARPDWLDPALGAARFTLSAQRPDGSWPYGVTARNRWVDSFHTGYVLVELDRMAGGTDLPGVDVALERGLAYWMKTFLVAPAVAHRPGRPFPVDMHAVAHAILTLLHFRARISDGVERARDLAAWSLAEMRAPDGSFHARRHRTRIDRAPYLRWVQAWMLRAFAELAAVDPETAAVDPKLAAVDPETA